MDLGKKLRNTRLEAGLSQRQLCEGIVTRNMLSQIENGSAKPSMKTLGLLAERLGKNISFFLEETAVLSPNQRVMDAARSGYDTEDFAGAIEALEHYREPDPVYDREFTLLWNLCHMAFACQQHTQGREAYAKTLLEKAVKKNAYCAEALERQRLLLLGQLTGERVTDRLPSLDEELLLRAREAESVERAEYLLEAAENQSSAAWNYMRGSVYFAKKQYEAAAECLHRAESARPEETAAMLEVCYRELGDFKQAYFYACKQK